MGEIHPGLTRALRAALHRAQSTLVVPDRGSAGPVVSIPVAELGGGSVVSRALNHGLWTQE